MIPSTSLLALTALLSSAVAPSPDNIYTVTRPNDPDPPAVTLPDDPDPPVVSLPFPFFVPEESKECVAGCILNSRDHDPVRDALLAASEPGSEPDVLYRHCRVRCVPDLATNPPPPDLDSSEPGHPEAASVLSYDARLPQDSSSSPSSSSTDVDQEIVIPKNENADDTNHEPVQHTTLTTAVRPVVTAPAPNSILPAPDTVQSAPDTVLPAPDTILPAPPFFITSAVSPSAAITPFDYCVINCFRGHGHLPHDRRPPAPIDDYTTRLYDCHRACLDRLPSSSPSSSSSSSSSSPSEKTVADVTLGDSEPDVDVDVDAADSAAVPVVVVAAAPPTKEPLPTDFAPTTSLSAFDVCVFHCVYHSAGTPPVVRFIYLHFIKFCYNDCDPTGPDTTTLPPPIPGPQQQPTADDVRRLLGLVPNAEHGFYVETFRDPTNVHFTRRRPSSCRGPNDKTTESNDITSVLQSPHTTTTTTTTTTTDDKGYSASTAIYYLLRAGDGLSFWHAVDAPEVWHFYAGSPLVLELSWNRKGESPDERVLGNDLFKGQRPQIVVGAGQWQRARTTGDWTLVGTTVAPGFDFLHGYEVQSAEGWKPDGSHPNATFHRYTV